MRRPAAPEDRARPALASGSAERWKLRLTVGSIVAVAVSLSGWWAVRVPMFVSPDEDVHFDYVVSLVSAGRPLLASERVVTQIAPRHLMPDSHPHTWHLAIGANSMALRSNSRARVPPGYGSRPFFAALSRSAPAIREAPLRNPWGVTGYPVGYFWLTAGWAAGWERLFPGPVTVFFAARAFSVLLLGGGLLLWWLVLRRQGCPPWRAAGVLAVVACLPLTTFVSSYVQPENLSFAVVPLCLWLAMRAAAAPASAARLAAAGLGLAGLLLTKYHHFLVVGLPVLALLAHAHARWKPRRWFDFALLLGAPSLVAAQLQLWVSSGGSPLRFYDITRGRAALLQELAPLAYLGHELRALAESFFGVEGHAFSTFWYLFGMTDLRIAMGWRGGKALTLLVLQLGTVAIALLLAARWVRGMAALVRGWRQGQRTRALRLLAGNPMLNSYLLLVGVLWALFLYYANGAIAQGRHWYGLLPVLVWAALDYAPRALTSRRKARSLGRLVLASLLLFGVIGSVWGLRTIEMRYYRAAPPPAAEAESPRRGT